MVAYFPASIGREPASSFCARRVEKSSNVDVSVFVVDREVAGSTNVIMIVDALPLFVSSDVVVDICD